jgi:hypothetical protein
VVGNVVAANYIGMAIQVSGSAIGNDVLGSRLNGINASQATVTIQRNNIVGNGVDPTWCGTNNTTANNLIATNNYWGAATGPGLPPANQACNDGGGTTTTTPFATRPFTVSAPIKP